MDTIDRMIGSYSNGNYKVQIFEDGTKIRTSDSSSFNAEFPECIDIKITNKCDLGCSWCHENSTFDGEHADLDNIPFIDSLRPFTELAIGGGNPIDHPGLQSFLSRLRKRKIIANITVNQKHFKENYAWIRALQFCGLLHGIGVSLSDSSDAEFRGLLSYTPNSVLHVINGLFSIEDIKNLRRTNTKILILGYKRFGRGESFFNAQELQIMTDNAIATRRLIESAAMTKIFPVVSFDNLALDQLKIKDFMPKEDWDKFFMGDDGKFTMYIDMVKRQFARCSVSNKRMPIGEDIVDMFNAVNI